MSSQWYDAYNKQIVNFTKTSNYIGDVYRLDKQDGSFIERAYYGIGIVDTRNVNNGLGSDGSDSFFPNANNPNLANKMTPIFHSDYFDSGDWKSSIIMRGWSGQYRAWRITGNASYGDNESDFYLSQSKASDGTWLPYRKIWTDRNLPNPVSQSQLNNYLPLTGGTLSGVLNLQNLNSLALNGGQIINAANGDTLYMGNPSVTNFYLESNNSDLLHNRSGYGVGRIWDEHNFKPDSKLNQTGASYRLDWDGATDNLYRDNVLLGYILNSNNILGFGFVTQSNLSTQLNNYLNKFAIDYIGASHDLNSLSQTGFYNVGHGTVGDATSYLNNTGAKALLHLQSEDPYTALQIQSHRYNGNLISRSKSDGVFSTWIRHWGDNDFTAADVSRWNNSISQSSASEEVILEDDTLKIQPDEFSLQGNSSYDIGSKKKLVHVLFREGTELNIRDLTRRQTIVVFNFSKDRINLNIEGLKPYPLSPEMQVTLYISDEGEVMLYNENSFKKLQ